MAELVIRLFGAIEARLNDRPIPKLWERKGDELLALLVLQCDQEVSSETLSRMLWPDGDGDVDRLRHSVKSLRGKLGPFGKQIIAGPHCYSFNTNVATDCQLDIDIVTFDRVDAQTGDPATLHSAVLLFDRGTLLGRWLQERGREWLRTPWFRHENERRKGQYVEMVEAVIRHARSEAASAMDEDPQEAVRWHRKAADYFRRMSKVCPWLEAVYAGWMAELMAAGERLEAIHLYDHFRDYLQTRHRLDPPAAMTALLHRALADSCPGKFAMPTLQPERLAAEAVGGAMPVDSVFYLPRPADREFHAAIARRDRIILLKGARQVGKTSLLMRGMEQARRAGAKVVLTNLARLADIQLRTIDDFFLALTHSFADILKLNDTAPARYWSPHRAATMNFDRYLKDCVLASFPDRLFWAIDEADRLFACPYKDDVFSTLRALCNERSGDPDDPIERLTVAISYSTEPYLFISDLNVSPFNLVPSLALTDWTPSEVAAMNRLCGSPLREAEADRFYRLVGGHPFLVRRALYAMQVYGMEIDDLEAQAENMEGVFGGHLAAVYDSLIHDCELTEMMCGLLREKQKLVERGYLRLHAAGLIVGNSPEVARLRCDLYRRFLEAQLL